MTTTTSDTLGTGGAASGLRPFVVSRARTARRIVVDRVASRAVVLGGLVVIASILAILLVIVAEILPLFRSARATFLGVRPVPDARPGAGAAAGIDEYREIAYELTADGRMRFVPLRPGDQRVFEPVAIGGLAGASVSVVAADGKGRHLVGTTDGRVVTVDVGFEVAFTDERRTVTPAVQSSAPVVLDAARRPIRALAFATPSSGALTIAQVGPRELVVAAVAERKALVGPSEKVTSLRPVSLAIDDEVTVLAVDGRGEDLFAGTSSGRVLRLDLRDGAGGVLLETTDVVTSPGTAVTALGFLLGDRTLVVGDARGEVGTWQVVKAPERGEARLTPIHRFAPHTAPVVSIAASRRDKGFATADGAGGVHLAYGTTGRTLLTLRTPGGLRSVVFAPKADGLVALDERGGLAQWWLDNQHPEITLGTLFGRVWYEGYSRPEYVWQSTGGTDDFEAKFSLTPLVFGTLKGTFYALLFAVPLALLAAVYVSEFMHPRIKGVIKPVVEIMAALPSVVLGFLAGLWLAPRVERVVPGLFIAPLAVAGCALVAMALWHAVPRDFRKRLRPGSELLALMPAVLVGVWLAFLVGEIVDQTLLGGNYRGWLLSTFGLTYDQRNSLVVGIAMGFAVIPIIFTIAEDSLANVPQHLRAGSLALGATRWQTAVRIVLPTASPGIFSAIMIGFGRAVGETMIVLMATGNTPVLDWSIFNGFRALSANIAVELPEAPEGGTLFRVLFVAAFLLFCLTFAVNTVAELVRLRLRARYRYL